MNNPPDLPNEKEYYAAFGNHGDLQALLVLADQAEEWDQGHYANLLRNVAAAANPAIQWFFHHSHDGKGVFTHREPRAKTETHYQALLRLAARYAWVEAWASNRCNARRARWEWMQYGYIDDEPVDPEDLANSDLYECTLRSLNEDGYPAWELGRMGGIDLGRMESAAPLRVSGEMGTVGNAVVNWRDCKPICRLVEARVAEDAYLGEGEGWPEWLTIEPETSEREEYAVFREMNGQLFILFPELPSEAAIDGSSLYNCVCFLLDMSQQEGSRLRGTIYGEHYASFASSSKPVNMDLDWPRIACSELHLAGIKFHYRTYKNSNWCHGAKPGYRERFKKRLAEERAKRIPF